MPRILGFVEKIPLDNKFCKNRRLAKLLSRSIKKMR